MQMFDAHSDLFMRCCEETKLGNENYLLNTHIHHLRAGKFCGNICVLFTEVMGEIPWNQYFWSEMGNICYNLREIEKSNIVAVVKSYEDILDAMKEGKHFIMLGIEGLGAIGDDVNQIETLYRLGFRHCSLTWNEKNLLATGVKNEDGVTGLTEAGIKAVEKMEELGMLVDVSHLSEKGFWDLMKVAKKPVIATHSNAKALCNHVRNLTDKQAIAIAKTGGVIGINVCGIFVHEKKPGLETFVDHIDYFKKLIGIEHVALGFDYCNFLHANPSEAIKGDFEEKKVEGITYVKDAYKVLDELQRRGYTEEEIEKISQGNLLRVIKEVVK